MFNCYCWTVEIQILLWRSLELKFRGRLFLFIDEQALNSKAVSFRMNPDSDGQIPILQFVCFVISIDRNGKNFRSNWGFWESGLWNRYSAKLLQSCNLILKCEGGKAERNELVSK